jgi:hypothetical protein|tara:strand:+ start:202 stop:894 length:693 start_codon:yes stop_codon:yes gene_type:complete
MAGASPNAFKTGALKSKIMNLAQTSVYQVKIQPPPNVLNFLRTERSLDYIQRGENIELLCHQTTLPGTSFSTTEATNNYTGVTERMIYRRMYDSTIDMTFYVDKAYDVIEFFEGWVDYMSGMNIDNPNSGDTREMYRSSAATYRMNYPSTYRTPIQVTKFEKNLTDAQMTYEFVDAFPLNIISIPVSYEQSDILKLSVSFAYTRYVRFRSKQGLLNNYGEFFNPKGPNAS